MTVRPFAIDGNGKQCHTKVINALYHLTEICQLCSVCREDSRIDAVSLHQNIYFGMGNYGGVAKPGSDFMEQGSLRILLVSRLGFRS